MRWTTILAALSMAGCDDPSAQPADPTGLTVLAGELQGDGGLNSSSGDSDGTGSAARFDSPFGITGDGAGNLFVADTYNGTIRRVVIATGVVTTLAGTAGYGGTTDDVGTAARFNGPYGVASDGAGNLYVSDADTIREIVTATGSVSTLAGNPFIYGASDGSGADALFNSPYGLAVSGGDLYVADFNNDAIRKIALPSGEVSTLAGAPGFSGAVDGIGSAARFDGPYGITADGAGNLFVSDTGSSTIRKIVIATGEVTTLAGMAGVSGSADGIGEAARFDGASGISSDGSGNLYIADTFNSTVRKLSLATGEVSTVVGAAGLAGVQTGPLPARLNCPGWVAVVAGDLLITDYCEHAVLIARHLAP